MWLRLAYRSDGERAFTRWGQLLVVPTKGYVEGPGGPIRERDVEWIDIAPLRISNGLDGTPVRTQSVDEEVIAALRSRNISFQRLTLGFEIEGLVVIEETTALRILPPSARPR